MPWQLNWNGTPEERFWRMVNKGGPIPNHRPELGACWLWTGTTIKGGYGRFTSGGHKILAHRFAYELLVGPVPGGFELDHLCRVPSCANTTHVEPVSHQVNCQRGSGSKRKVSCLRGHQFNAENTYLTPGGRRQCRTCKQRRGLAYKEVHYPRILPASA